MFVVNTIPQLQEALREGAREVMVIGSLAPEILEFTEPYSVSVNCDLPTDFSFTSLFEKFSIQAVHDRSQKVVATVFQERDDLG